MPGYPPKGYQTEFAYITLLIHDNNEKNRPSRLSEELEKKDITGALGINQVDPV